MRVLISNKSIGLDYELVDKYEAGLRLQGWEVKSIKNARANIKGSFVTLTASLIPVIRGMHVSDWIGETHTEFEKNRERALLLNKQQIRKIALASKQPGFSLVPTQIYENDKGLIKAEIAVVKGRKKFDKKRIIKERDIARELKNSW